MRLLRDENGEKVFKPKDYLTIDQVTSMFSRMASQKKKEQIKEPVKHNIDDDSREPWKKAMMKKTVQIMMMCLTMKKTLASKIVLSI